MSYKKVLVEVREGGVLLFLFSTAKGIISFVLISYSFNDAVSSPDYVPLNDWMIVNNQVERMWKEATESYFKVLSRNLPEGPRKSTKQEVLGRNDRLLYNTSHIENDASNNSSTVACAFVTAVTFLPSRCLAKIRGFLLSRCLATIEGNRQTHTDNDVIS
jgi:hypothetical protein